MTLQLDNSNLSTKLKIRNNILDKINAPLCVVDACAGNQVIWNSIQETRNVKSYIPIDHEGKGNSIKIEAQDFFKGIELPDSINVIDIDTYGSPWEIYHLAIDALTSQKKVAFFLTRGFIRMMGGGSFSKHEKCIAGIPENWKVPTKTSILEAVDKVNLTYPFRFGWKIKSLLKSKSNSSNYMHYYGFVIEK